MEPNRKRVFKVVIPLIAAGTCAALLFGITGVLQDPAAPVDLPSQPQKASVTTASAPAQPVASPLADGGSATEEKVVKVDEKEPFPQMDDEPHGS